MKRRNVFEILGTELDVYDFQRSLSPGNKDSFVTKYDSIEIYPIDDLLSIHRYLSDLAVLHPLHQEENHGEPLMKPERDSLSVRIHRMYTLINKLVNPSKHDTVRILNGKMFMSKHYGYNNEEEVGRMYSDSTTMQLLSRQIRYPLFSDIYVDVDLSNSHPTILHKYALDNNKNVPCLSKYVIDRDSVFSELINETKLSKSELKRIILMALNIDDMKSNIDFVDDLNSEVQNVRNVLWNEYKDSDTNLWRYFSNKIKHRKVKNVKVSFQATYCQHTESYYVNMLRERIIRDLELYCGSHLYTDKPYLSFIPFHDGAYIAVCGGEHGFDVSHKIKLLRYLEIALPELNSLTYPMNFSVKKIEPDWSYMSADRLMDYKQLRKTLDDMSFTKYTEIINKYGLKDSKSSYTGSFCENTIISSRKHATYVRTSLIDKGLETINTDLRTLRKEKESTKPSD